MFAPASVPEENWLKVWWRVGRDDVVGALGSAVGEDHLARSSGTHEMIGHQALALVPVGEADDDVGGHYSGFSSESFEA